MPQCKKGRGGYYPAPATSPNSQVSQMYITIPDSQSQSLFAQIRPNHMCPQRGEFKRRSRRLGYKCRCRNPRCSWECLRAWCRQESIILSYCCDKMCPPTRLRLRGNLTLRDGATPQDHKIARTKFRRAIDSHYLKIRCYSHITSHDDCHYDFVGHSEHEPRKSQMSAGVSV